MATMSRITLSGSTDGRGIKVAATSIGSGTTIHTVSTGIDEIDLWVANNAATSYTLTVGWGGTTAVDDTIVLVVPAYSYLPVVLKLALKNSLVVKASADTANKLSIFGAATRIA